MSSGSSWVAASIGVFIRGRWVHRVASCGFMQGSWVHRSAPWGSSGSSGVAGLIRVCPVGIEFIQGRCVFIGVRPGGRRVHQGSLG